MGWKHILSCCVSIFYLSLFVSYVCFSFAQYIYGVYLGLNGKLGSVYMQRALNNAHFRSFTLPHTDRVASCTTASIVCGIHSIATRFQRRSMGA